MIIYCSECRNPRNVKTCIQRFDDEGKQNGFTCKCCIKKFLKQGKMHVPKTDNERPRGNDIKS